MNATEINGRGAVATSNTCRLCAPLGAAMVFRGIAGAVSLLHGSQGCATYIRRYLIGHFREPIDIASSSFGEETAIFGGRERLFQSLDNIIEQYQPALIGVATTCISETIGDDVGRYIREFAAERDGPPVIHVSTPSFRGSHTDGFHDAVQTILAERARFVPRSGCVALLPGMVSPADMRHIREIVTDFGIEYVMFPDYSDTLDGPVWREYQAISEGGTPLVDINRLGGAAAVVELGRHLEHRTSGGSVLSSCFGVQLHRTGVPIGIGETDLFFSVLQEASGRPTPTQYVHQRERLIDAYIDGHKYVFGRRVAVCADEDLLVGITGLLVEIGMVPVLCATGSRSGNLGEALRSVAPGLPADTQVLEGADYETIEEHARELSLDCIVGSSKCYGAARRLGVPLVRAGFPVHDRMGGQRMLHVGYAGTQQLFDSIVNALIEHEQRRSPVGYMVY
jgi:nitrogenase molybdenum-iron protein NifN